MPFLKKTIYAFILLLIPFGVRGQTSVKSSIIDVETKQAIAYCNIFNQATQSGVISNSEGDFSIRIQSLDDVIHISFLGYETRHIQARKILELKSISLKPKQYQLQEVEIYSDNDYLYDILIQCRKSIRKKNANYVSKAFFSLNTSTKNQALESLECYYNAYQSQGRLKSLMLKNGKLALLPLDSRFFLNLNTTQSFSKINFIEKNTSFPAIILQFRKREMKRRFELNLDYCDSELYKISFNPKQNPQETFNGEIWIDKKSMMIKKIRLWIENTRQHPFMAFGNDSIEHISINLNEEFRDNDKQLLINHLVLDLQINYISRRDSVSNSQLPFLKRNIEINSVLYCYDYNKPFILPYFEYDNGLSDYRKLSIIPYNQSFWNYRKLLLTKDQKDKLGIMSKQGIQINTTDQEYGIDFMQENLKKHQWIDKGHTFFENQAYLFWDKDKRIRSENIGIQDSKFSHQSSIQVNKYRFYIQILLDINETDDIFDCQSYSVFDQSKSFYYLEENEYSNAFLNIYFDICEIERQKMQEQLNIKNQSLAQIDSIYQQTLLNMETITHQYKKEVQHGKNFIMLKKWNAYVKENLDIDNIEMFSE